MEGSKIFIDVQLDIHRSCKRLLAPQYVLPSCWTGLGWGGVERLLSSAGTKRSLGNDGMNCNSRPIGLFVVRALPVRA